MQNNNSLFSILRGHKKNKMGFFILIGLSALIIGYQLIEYINLIGFDVQIIFLLAPILITVGFSLYYEYNKLSFIAHLIFFTGLLEPYIRDFYAMIFQSGTLDFATTFTTMVGALISVYMILKMIAHNQEIKSFIPSIRRNIMFLLVLVLINLYLLESLQASLVLLLLIIMALLTGGPKMTLPLVLMIYITKIVSAIHVAYLIGNNLGNYNKTNLMVNVVIYVLMIYYTIRLMREEDNILYS